MKLFRSTSCIAFHVDLACISLCIIATHLLLSSVLLNKIWWCILVYVNSVLKKRLNSRWVMLWNMFSHIYKTTSNNFCSCLHKCIFHISPIASLGMSLAYIDTRLQLKSCLFCWVLCEQLNSMSGMNCCQREEFHSGKEKSLREKSDKEISDVMELLTPRTDPCNVMVCYGSLLLWTAERI